MPGTILAVGEHSSEENGVCSGIGHSLVGRDAQIHKKIDTTPHVGKTMEEKQKHGECRGWVCILWRLIKADVTEKIPPEQSSEGSEPCRSLGDSHVERQIRGCKGPEAGVLG